MAKRKSSGAPEPATKAGELRTPLRWRTAPTPLQSRGTLFQFVRDYLCSHSGSCSRAELRRALEADTKMAARLANSQGFTPLLTNMRHSGDIFLEGETVRASARTLRRMQAG